MHLSTKNQNETKEISGGISARPQFADAACAAASFSFSNCGRIRFL